MEYYNDLSADTQNATVLLFCRNYAEAMSKCSKRKQLSSVSKSIDGVESGFPHMHTHTLCGVGLNKPTNFTNETVEKKTNGNL